jgi:tagaturonate reductase
MQRINEKYPGVTYPIKVIQFGEGNFLRGFVDYGIDIANEKYDFNAGVAIIKPRPGNLDKFHEQDNLYTVVLRGIKNGGSYETKRVVKCVQKVLGAYENYEEFMQLAELETLEFVISNTTEAGIALADGDRLESCPPASYPAKLTKFLYKRYTHFKADEKKGLTILPVELSEKNGENLKKYVLSCARIWGLEKAFVDWINEHNVFAGTLVDRIVTGYPSDAEELQKKWGYRDDLMVVGEPFGLWVIGDSSVKKIFDISSPELTVEFTDELEKYKNQKVRILNGAHTSMALGSYLAGKNYVRECMQDQIIREQILHTVLDEIVPTVDIDRKKAEEFANFVFERFENPFVNHALLAISLNSVSKWKVRVLPTLRDIYERDGKLPVFLTFSFAALLLFYRTTRQQDSRLLGLRGMDTYEISDDTNVLEFIAKNAAKPTCDFVKNISGNIDFWGEDLSEMVGFVEIVTNYMNQIDENGMLVTVEKLLG